MQQSNSTASFRGIADVDSKIAWASGTAGTVLRTTDGGRTWQPCIVPPDAQKLDFRGIQAWDASNAIVMSSGKGDLSRLYRTTDACKTWKLIYTNPDAPDGFFDAILFPKPEDGWILGDPVKGRFVLEHTQDGGITWQRSPSSDLAAADKQGGAFAASNQSLIFSNSGPLFGGGSAWVYQGPFPACSLSVGYNDPDQCLAHMTFRKTQLPMAQGNGGSGIFALEATQQAIVAVGGDYTNPTTSIGTAAYSLNNGKTWQAAATTPRGYRSTLVLEENTGTWIATGPTGTDISTDNGNHWQPLLPNAAAGDTPDADRNWNALSLPFAVGPKGRIGRLRDDALPPATK